MDELICKSWSGNTPKIFDNTEKSATKDGISNITKGTTTAKTEEHIFADTSIESIKSLFVTLFHFLNQKKICKHKKLLPILSSLNLLILLALTYFIYLENRAGSDEYRSIWYRIDDFRV